MDNLIAVAKRVIKQEQDGLEELLHSIDDSFVRAVHLVANSRGKVVLSGMGKSGYIAKKIAATLSSTGSTAVFLHPAEAGHGDLGIISKDDVVVLLSNSGETQELNVIIDYCMRFEIPIIGMTRNIQSNLSHISKINLLLPDVAEAAAVNVPTTSTTMMLAMGDAMAIALLEMRGFSDADFRTFHPGGNIGVKLLQVQDLMHKSPNIPLIYANDTATSMLLEISEKRMGCTGVIDKDGQLIGIVTDGDLRRHMHLDMNISQVNDFMTLNPLTITADILGVQAISIMNQHSIMVLFVVADLKPIGVLHMHDLLKAGLS